MYTDAPLAAALSHFLHNFPRYHFDSNQESDAEWNPQSVYYYESISLFSFPFVFLGIFLVVTLSMIMILQHRKKISTQRAKKRSITLPRICLINFMLVAGVFGGIGILSAFGVGQEMKDSVDTLQMTETKMLTDVHEVIQIVQGLNQTQFLSPQVLNGIKWLDSADNKTAKYKETIINGSKQGEYALISFFGVIILFSIIGCIGGLASVKGIVIFVIIVGMILLPLTWGMVGAVTTSMVFLSDGCPVIENYVESKVDNNTKVWLNYYIYCEGISPFNDFINTTKGNLIRAEIELAYVMSHNVPNKQAVIEALRALIAELTTLDQKLAELNDCTTVQYSWDTARSHICTTLLDSLAGSFAAGSMIGIALFGAIWTAIKLKVVLRSIENLRHGYFKLDTNGDDSSSKEFYEMPSPVVSLLVK